jgi:hypothetical protein
MPRPPAALTMAKDRCRSAFEAAKEADAALSGIWSTVYRDTFDQVAGQPAHRAAVMFTRIAILFEVVADRRGWPERMR